MDYPLPFIGIIEQEEISRLTLRNRSDHDIPMPSSELFEIHFRFAKAVKLLKMVKTKEKAAQLRHSTMPTPGLKLASLVSGLLTRNLLPLWLCVPSSFRLPIYKGLQYLGKYFYPPTTYSVQQLPFNLYLKHGRAYSGSHHLGEFRALQLVRKYTSIPAPLPVDAISTPEASYLISSKMPGKILGPCIDVLDREDVDQMVIDLKRYLAELRNIPNPYLAEHSICNAAGQACVDFRLEGGATTNGPYKNEDIFNDSLRIGIYPGLFHRSDHSIVFTHGDLT